MESRAAHSDYFSDFLGAALDFDTFERGWAFAMRATTARAHYYVLMEESCPLFGRHGLVKRFRALCGSQVSSTRRLGLYAPGMATRCARCARAAALAEASKP